MNYGKELILDLHDCNIEKFTKKSLQKYFVQLCDLIDMERVKVRWWEDFDQTEPHLKGISAIQFIKTSNVTIHALELLQAVYVNIFSCKDFDPMKAKAFTENWFGGKTVNFEVIDRI